LWWSSSGDWAACPCFNVSFYGAGVVVQTGRAVREKRVKKILHPAFFLFGALVFLLIAPPVLGTLKADILVGFGIACLFAVSLNLLFETGLFSLGHALFFGTGGYTTALGLFYIEGLPLIPAILLGGSAAGLVGLLFSPLLLKASGIYFTLLTVALNQILYTTCLKFSEITGGETGFSNYLIPPLDLFGGDHHTMYLDYVVYYQNPIR
jgi:branched-chain amino acid transport system permease protein